MKRKLKKISPYFRRGGGGSQNFITAIGGTVTRVGNHLVHFITGTDTFEITQLADNDDYNELEVVVIGGGGGGGAYNYGANAAAGGGGAGEWKTAVLTAEIKSYTVTIGAGGAFQENNGNGGAGGNTTFDAITALGGGYGAGGPAVGGNGASGGGGAQNNIGGTGTAGYNGGTSLGVNNSGASGGGAGGAGVNCPEETLDVVGGLGITSSITGTSVVYCQGGVGNSTSVLASELDGPEGLGWGGAGANANGGAGRSGAGSSGGIIVKYFCPQNYYYRITELTEDSGIQWTDSSFIYPLDSNTLAMFGGYNNVDFLPYSVTDLWWTTSDGITFNEESPMPVGPSSHIIAGLRDDGYVWAFGKSQHLPGPTAKFWVAKIDTTTKVWTIIFQESDVDGDGYVQWGFFHKNYMYAAFSSGGATTFLKKSSDGLTWTNAASLPDYAFDSCAWSDGTRIRFGGGGQDIAATPITNPITNVYESLDDGETFSTVSALPSAMQSIWPSYILFNGYEFFLTGAWGPSNSDWGQMYYRELGNGAWTYAQDLYQRFDLLGVYPRHASALGIFKNKLFIASGTFNSVLAIDRR